MLNRWKEFLSIKLRKASGKKVSALACLLTVLALGLTGCSDSYEPSDIDEQLTQNETTQNQQTNTDQGTTDAVDVDGNLIVRFLDVGQGNSVLVECDGEYMLIDGGDYDYSSYVVAYLKNQGVETLKYMVVSHYDSDHLSGCVGALRAFDVETVICPDYEGDTKTYYTFAEDVVTYADATIHPEVGDTYEIGDAMFTVICPQEANYNDENDNSVGIRLVFGNNSFLICGDAGEDSEEDIVESGIEVQSDVFLANHHGSSSSNTYDFLQLVQPEVVVISCGYDNSYGHPAKATMNRLQNTGADLYRTDLQGELIAVSDGNTITWNVEPSNDFRCGEDVVTEGVEKSTSVTTGTVNGSDTSSSSSNLSTAATTYILNTNSGKFHLPSCSSVDDMDESNKKEVSSTISEMEAQGYSPCGRCLK